MILFSLLSVLSLCGPQAVSGPSIPAALEAAEPTVPSTRAEPDGVVKRYDLSAHNLLVDAHLPGNLLLPGSPRIWDEEDGTELVWAIDEDLILELVQTLCGDEFEYEGRVIMHSSGQLLVKAPPRVHAKVSGILSFLGEALHAYTELQVDVIDLSDKAAAGAGTGLVDIAEAERICTLGASATRLQSYRVPLFPGRAAKLDLTRQHRFLADYDVEVAQGAFAHDPVIHTMISGTRLEIRGAPAAGGLSLTVLFRHGSPTGELEEVDLDQHGFVGSEAGQNILGGPRMTQSFGVIGRAFACNTALPSGQALVLRSALDLKDAGGAQLVIVRQIGAPLRTVYGTGALGTGSDLSLVNLQSLVPPRLVFRGSLLEKQLRVLEADRLHWYEFDPLLTTEIDWGECDGLAELIQRSCPDRQFSGDGSFRWLIGRYDPELSRELGESGEEASKVEEVVRSLIPEDEVVQVSFTLRRRGEGVSKGARCDLVASVGHTSAVVLGVEATTTTDYDIEIAQASAVADPVTWMSFDGLALTVSPRRNVSGDLFLELRGFAHLLSREDSFDPVAPLHGGMDQQLFDQLLVDEILTVTEENGGTFRIGDTDGGGPLTLDVQVH